MAVIQYDKPLTPRGTAHLTPSLIGLEGCRVEVTNAEGEKRRFWVGKSTGWVPCHLEIARTNCYGGPAVFDDFGDNVRIVRYR